jgi:hypothetical protein
MEKECIVEHHLIKDEFLDCAGKSSQALDHHSLIGGPEGDPVDVLKGNTAEHHGCGRKHLEHGNQALYDTGSGLFSFDIVPIPLL